MANKKISAFTTVTDGQGSKPDVRNLSAIAGVEGAANAKISGTELVSSVINSNNSGAASVVPHRVTFYNANGESLAGSENFSWDNTSSTMTVSNTAGGPLAGRLDLTHEEISQTNDSGLTITSDAGITIKNGLGAVNSFRIPNANTGLDGFQMYYESFGGGKHYITGSAGNNGYIRFSQQNGELEMGDSNRVSLASTAGSDLELKVGSNTDDLRVYLGTNGPSIGDILAVGGLDGNVGLMEWSTPSTTSSAVLQTVYNNTVSTLNKGQVVYLPGGNQGDNPHAELAQSNSSSTMPALGVVTNNITAASTGTVMITGELTGLDLTGFTTGDDLFISNTVAGGLQNTPPTGEANLIQKIGKVVNGGPGGALTVLGAFRANATSNLNEGSIFLGDSNNQSTTLGIGANNTVLTSNGTTASWQAAAGGVKTFTTLTTSTPTWTIANGYNATWALVAGANTLSIVAVNGDSGSIIIDSSLSTTLTYPANSQFTDGGTAPTLSGGTDVLSFLYDGTNYYWTYGLDFAP